MLRRVATGDSVRSRRFMVIVWGVRVARYPVPDGAWIKKLFLCSSVSATIEIERWKEWMD